MLYLDYNSGIAFRLIKEKKKHLEREILNLSHQKKRIGTAKIFSKREDLVTKIKNDAAFKIGGRIFQIDNMDCKRVEQRGVAPLSIRLLLTNIWIKDEKSGFIHDKP